MQKLRILGLLLVLVATTHAQFPIGHASFSYLDASRNNRDVFGEVYYPATIAGDDVPVAIGDFPIIVFGHGFVTAWSEYQVWWDSLVPQGFIMVFPRTEGSINPNHGEFGTDLSFLIDTYLAEDNNNSSPFFQKINGKSAVMGHSMGGGAAFLAAEQNTNVNTLLTLAAAETNPSAIAAAVDITIPSLTLSGSLDCVAPPNDHQILMYNALSSSYKAYIEIIGGSHCQFGIASGGSNCNTGEFFACPFASYIPKADQHEYMIASSIPWLKYHLFMDCDDWDSFHNYLTTATTHTYAESGTEPCTCEDDIIVNGNIPMGIHQANISVTSDGTVQDGVMVIMRGSSVVNLNNGFTAEVNCDFEANNDPCEN